MNDRNYPPKRWVWLTELIQRHGWKVGAEVGVKAGENIAYLLKHNPDLFMHAVDPWAVQPGATEDYRDWNMEKVYADYLHAIEPYKDRVQTMRLFSIEAADMFGDRELDFVFIDAMHDYPNLMQDIRAWRPKCRHFISGHDYWPMFPGVERAVRESFPEGGIVLGPNTCWGVYLEH